MNPTLGGPLDGSRPCTAFSAWAHKALRLACNQQHTPEWWHDAVTTFLCGRIRLSYQTVPCWPGRSKRPWEELSTERATRQRTGGDLQQPGPRPAPASSPRARRRPGTLPTASDPGRHHAQPGQTPGNRRWRMSVWGFLPRQYYKYHSHPKSGRITVLLVNCWHTSAIPSYSVGCMRLNYLVRCQGSWSTGLAKKFVPGHCKMVWKNPDALFGRANVAYRELKKNSVLPLAQLVRVSLSWRFSKVSLASRLGDIPSKDGSGTTGKFRPCIHLPRKEP